MINISNIHVNSYNHQRLQESVAVSLVEWSGQREKKTRTLTADRVGPRCMVEWARSLCLAAGVVSREAAADYPYPELGE